MQDTAQQEEMHLEPLMRRNFIEYASYVVMDRAIPDIRDGCKPVQRRILSTLFEMDDGKFHKVANVIGETMKLHPHGDASISDALVVLANKEYFIEKQGNFGNLLTGHPAAAARYIECRLTPLAKDTLFNPDLTAYSPSYDGRKNEPDFLPAKLPVLLLLGTEGIAVGMATKILPHNFCELLKAQIKLLEGKDVRLVPDFPQGGQMDASEYKDGRGKVRVRARIDRVGEKGLVIREIPVSTTTEGLIASIEAAVQKNKVKIASIDDYTTDKVEILLTLPRGVHADEAIPLLYAYTDCEVSISSNIVAIRDQHPVELTVSDVLWDLTERLRGQIRAELQHALEAWEDKQHWLTLQQLFIENKVYKKLETAGTEESLHKVVRQGLEPFADAMIRPLTDDDVNRLLELRIRRISAFDRQRNDDEIEKVVKAIKKTRSQLRQLTKTTIAYLQGLLDKYGKEYPRRTKVKGFDIVDKKAVALQNIKLNYDAKTGFFGRSVKRADAQVVVSEYDVILAISEDGSYRIMTVPQDKVLLSGNVIHLAVFDAEAGETFTVVYRDKKKNMYAKKVAIEKFIRNKEYALIKNKEGKIDLLTQDDHPGVLKAKTSTRGKAKAQEVVFDLSTLEYSGVSTRGTRIGTKPIARFSVVSNARQMKLKV